MDARLTPKTIYYLIYPNGQTVFVKTPNMDIKNFWTVGFTKTIGVNKQLKNT
jgi:uncharacterized membrane protein